MRKIKPLGNRLLVRRSQAQTSKGGIILPDSAQKKPREGEVIAVGPGKIDENGQLESLTVKVGDHILFGEYAGTEVEVENEKYLIVSEEDVIGILS
jgi:chaperonin GroES